MDAIAGAPGSARTATQSKVTLFPDIPEHVLNAARDAVVAGVRAAPDTRPGEPVSPSIGGGHTQQRRTDESRAPSQPKAKALTIECAEADGEVACVLSGPRQGGFRNR